MSDIQLMILVIILLVGVVIILDRSHDRLATMLGDACKELNQAIVHIMNQDRAIRNLTGFLEEQGYNPTYIQNIILERSNGTKSKDNGSSKESSSDDQS